MDKGRKPLGVLIRSLFGPSVSAFARCATPRRKSKPRIDASGSRFGGRKSGRPWPRGGNPGDMRSQNVKKALESVTTKPIRRRMNRGCPRSLGRYRHSLGRCPREYGIWSPGKRRYHTKNRIRMSYDGATTAPPRRHHGATTAALA